MKDKIEQYLKEKGITTAQFAREAGLSYNAVDNILKGKTDGLKVGVSKALKIAEAMGTTLEAIYGVKVAPVAASSPELFEHALKAEEKTEEESAVVPTANSEEMRLLNNYKKLNSEGRAKVLAYLDDLIATNKYF